MNPKHGANSNSGTDQDSFSVAYILKAHLYFSGKIVCYCRVREELIWETLSSGRGKELPPKHIFAGVVWAEELTDTSGGPN